MPTYRKRKQKKRQRYFKRDWLNLISHCSFFSPLGTHILIALGLTTLGTGLLSISPTTKLIFMLISLVVSIWMIFVALKKWAHNRPAAWVYLISSIISIILVATAIPKIYVDNNQVPPQQEPQHQIHHSQERRSCCKTN